MTRSQLSPLSPLALACGIATTVLFGATGLAVAVGIYVWRTPAPPTRQRWWMFVRIVSALGACGAVVGSVAGLIRGLQVYPATAWFAALELGTVGAVLGVLLGALAGAAAVLAVTVKVRPA